MPSKPLRFLLNKQEVSLAEINPNTTVLQYLRGHLGKAGTKEGCASGDCGACTVVVGEVSSNQSIRYKTLNACIALLPSLHGKQLITVEDLKSCGQMHSVQNAMVDKHGSQCGFCTPGFIMSMFALHKRYTFPTRQQTTEALSGNLCRCTGYKSIIDASMNIESIPDHFDSNKATVLQRLQAITSDSNEVDGIVELSGGGCRAFLPKTIDELAKLATTYPTARLVAGGTDLCLDISQNLKQFEILISTLNVVELCQVQSSDSGFTIGAAANYSQTHSLFSKEFPEWAAMIDRLGSLQIRNFGTVGGNIANASPVGDMAPVLIATQAKLRLRKDDKTRDISIEDFFIEYKVTALEAGEFIQSIFIPKPLESTFLKVYKVSKRFDDDISAVLAVINVQIVDNKVLNINIAFGGMAAIPKRASQCEAELIGQTWTEGSIERAIAALSNDFSPLSDARASSAYRIQVAQNLVRRAYIEISSPETLTQVLNHA